MLTKREKIIRQFLSRAAYLTTANGYFRDMGLHVIRARKRIDPKELDAVIIFPKPEEATDKYGFSECRFTMHIEGIVKFREEGPPVTEINPSAASEQILGDLINCFMSPEWSRDPELVTDIAYRGGGTESYPEDGEVSVGAYADFQVTYEVDLGKTEYEPEGEISETLGLTGSVSGETE